VTAGMLGPPDKSLYDVLGDVVNLASRYFDSGLLRRRPGRPNF
jgi:hypothetical protein